MNLTIKQMKELIENYEDEDEIIIHIENATDDTYEGEARFIRSDKLCNLEIYMEVL